MKGKWQRLNIHIALAMLFLTSPLPILAVGFPDVLDDPLLARPPVLDKGARLPDDSILPCPAQNTDFNSLTLDQAVDVALCNNPQIRLAWAGIKIATGTLGEARAAYLPTVNGSFSRLKNNTSYPGSTLYSSTNSTGNQIYANASWRLFDFGGRSANRQYANQLLIAALAGHDAALQKAMTMVIGAYFDVLTNRAVYEAKTQMAQFAQNTLEATKRREAAGVSTLNDSLQASTALAKAQLVKARTGGDYKRAMGVLNQSMGINPQISIELPIQLERVAPVDMKDLNAWLVEAQERHPAIIGARAKWEADKAKITTARSEGLPTLDATSYFSQNGYPNQSLSVINQNTISAGLTINIPIFEGFSRTYKIRGAQARADESEAQMQETINQVLTDIVKAHADAITSLSTVSASELLLQSAQSGAESSRRRYERNAADILELLNAQSFLADAQQERIRALAEYRSARLRLLATSGMLGKLPQDN